MKVFAQLRALTEYRRRHLPFIETVTDMDIVCEIGHHQVLHTPVTLNDLAAAGIAPVATLQRRVRRLKRLGLVRGAPSPVDARAVELRLAAAPLRAFRKYGAIFAAIQRMR